MAVSGLVLFLFVIGHLIGNLQIYEGPEKLNNYAKFLRSVPAALWTVRITLLVMVLLHIWSSVQLALLKFDARPAGYVKKKATKSSYASRTMYWSGPIILVFVIYHLLDFTFGTRKSAFRGRQCLRQRRRELPIDPGLELSTSSLCCCFACISITDCGACSSR